MGLCAQFCHRFAQETGIRADGADAIHDESLNLIRWKRPIGAGIAASLLGSHAHIIPVPAGFILCRKRVDHWNIAVGAIEDASERGVCRVSIEIRFPVGF